MVHVVQTGEAIGSHELIALVERDMAAIRGQIVQVQRRQEILQDDLLRLEAIFARLKSMASLLRSQLDGTATPGV